MPVGAEALQGLIEADLAAIVTPKMQRRIPAARHGDEIAFDLLLGNDPALALAISGDLGAGDVEAAERRLDGGDDRTRRHIDAGVPRFVGEFALGAGAGVDDTHADAGALQRKGSEISVI